MRGFSRIVPLLMAAACASTAGGFAQLPADEQAMFRRCGRSVSAQRCAGASDGARCLGKQAATFAARRSTRLRRNWLLQNECPASVIDAVETAVASALPAPIPSVPASPALTPDAPPPQSEPPAEPQPQLAPTPATVALLPAGAACKRSADCASDLCVRSACVTLEALELARACPENNPATVTAAPAAPVPAAPVASVPARAPAIDKHSLAKLPAPVRLAAGRGAPEQLREVIVSHEADMKKCVERQLKLVPDLRAAGTLVLEVDAAGKVTQAALRGDRLQGTPLEGCVRALATRWVFPRTSRAYAVEAPLEVSGISEARP